MVEMAVNAKGLAEAARAAGQLEALVPVAVFLHEFDALYRLHRADEHRSADAIGFGDDIEAVARVDGVNVGPAGPTEHGGVALGPAACGVTGRIAFGQVGLDLDDAPNEASPAQCSHEQLAKQITGNLWG